MKKPIVGIDMDDVLYSFVSPLLDRYNLRYNDQVRYDDITDWNIHQFLNPECKDIFSEFVTEGFFEGLSIPQNRVNWLSVLNIIADIKFVTAGGNRTLLWREALLRRELDFFEDDMLVRLTDKRLLDTDYLVDDNPHTCKAVKDYNPNVLVFQVAKPWNSYEGYDTDSALTKIIIDILKG